jgi:hypothetical protein
MATMPGVARLQLKALVLIVAVVVAACLLLGFVLPAFRNPVAIFLACMVAICFYGAPRAWWREPDLLTVLGVVSAIGLVLFLVSPAAASVGHERTPGTPGSPAFAANCHQVRLMDRQ